MWIFTQHGFFSVVNRSEPAQSGAAAIDVIEIRSRYREHLSSLKERFAEQIGASPIIGYDDPEHESDYAHRDYEYRLIVSVDTWLDLAADLAADITYPNFKSAVHAQAKRSGLEATPYENQCFEVYWAMQSPSRR